MDGGHSRGQERTHAYINDYRKVHLLISNSQLRGTRNCSRKLEFDISSQLLWEDVEDTGCSNEVDLLIPENKNFFEKVE